MLRTLIVVLVAFFTLAAGASAADINVAPGADLSAAYNSAASGDSIVLACGSYGQWDTPSGGTKSVTIRAATRNCAKFSRLHAKSANLTFDGIDVDAGGQKPMCGGSDCAAFEIWDGSTGVKFKNGRIGNVGGQKGAFLHGSSDPSPKGVVIENTNFHDVRITAAGQHLECVMSHVPGVTFRGNTFTNCGVYDISLGLGDWWGQPQYGNVTLENNVFGHSVDGGAGGGWHYNGLAWWLTSLDGARVVNNTFEQNISMDRTTSGNGVWANNLGGGWSCIAGVTYAGNVGQKCSAADKAVSPTQSTYNTPAPFGWTADFHLTAGSPAIDAGSSAYAPLLDRDGNGRVGAPDAGAYEFQGSPPPPADADGDGISDAFDQCPTQPGPASNNGCPVPPPPADSDGDGVADSVDQCPTQAGPSSNNGCPVPPPPTGFVGRKSTGQTKTDWSGSGELDAWSFTSSAISATKLCGLTNAASSGVSSVDLALYRDSGSSRPTTRLATARYTGTPAAATPFCVTIPATTLPASGKVWVAWVPHGNRLNFKGDAGSYTAVTGITSTPPATWPSGGATGSTTAAVWAE